MMRITPTRVRTERMMNVAAEASRRPLAAMMSLDTQITPQSLRRRMKHVRAYTAPVAYDACRMILEDLPIIQSPGLSNTSSTIPPSEAG
jgi:hypothetical protein